VVQKAILRILQQIYEGSFVWSKVDLKTFSNFDDPFRLNFGPISKRKRIIDKEIVYEIRKWILTPIFNNNSFGFRPNRSVHSVFKVIKMS
jgi:hypothetical protein